MNIEVLKVNGGQNVSELNTAMNSFFHFRTNKFNEKLTMDGKRKK